MMGQETKSFSYECECSACSGTGLYCGMAERDGFGVVCHACKGTGRREITLHWKTFVGRKIHDNVKHVIQLNPGICIGLHGARCEFTPEDFGAMLYTDWLNGVPFEKKHEMRKFTCPAWWAQCTDQKKPEWGECIGCGAFSDCEHFAKKSECWERWDDEKESE